MTGLQEVRLRTAAWYGDHEVTLELPIDWDVTTLWPRTPPPLGPHEIAATIEHPVRQPPLRRLVEGKRRPVIIVDDLTRPTPANLVLPLLLQQMAEAGIAARDVTILVGGGTHAPAGQEQLARKVGAVAQACRVLAHDCSGDVVRLGRTSFGTPVLLNREVAVADLVVGVGGVYPQHSVGFGGGSKLILGVLGKRSIVALHYGHPSVAGTHEINNQFRRDLDEIAEMAGLRTLVTLHVNGDREVVRAVSGDYQAYYEEAVTFSRENYGVSTPGDADVVIVNAYPMDVSLTFARSKAMAPLYQARKGASRVLLSACPEGIGHHGLFPFLNGPRFERQIHQLRRLSVVRPTQLPAKIANQARKFARERVGTPTGPSHADIPVSTGASQVPPRPILFHPSGLGAQGLPSTVPGLRLEPDWVNVLAELRKEQAGNDLVRVLVYPCAGLQCLQWTGDEHTGYLAGGGIGAA